FLNKKPLQSVQSQLPLSFVQPLLRGGGRAVTLEPLTQAERNLLYQVRTFTRFRQEFFTAMMVGGNVTNSTDPSIGFLNVLQLLQIVENNRKNVSAFETLLVVYKELAKGESSGLTQLQIDQVDGNIQTARFNLIQAMNNYRITLDQFKQQIGIP